MKKEQLPNTSFAVRDSFKNFTSKNHVKIMVDKLGFVSGKLANPISMTRSMRKELKALQRQTSFHQKMINESKLAMSDYFNGAENNFGFRANKIGHTTRKLAMELKL